MTVAATRNVAASDDGSGREAFTWSGLTYVANPYEDIGRAAAVNHLRNVTLQAIGTFGSGGSMLIEGSNDGGTTWGALATSVALTTGVITPLTTVPALIRPKVTAGDNTTALALVLAGTNR